MEESPVDDYDVLPETPEAPESNRALALGSALCVTGVIGIIILAAILWSRSATPAPAKGPAAVATPAAPGSVVIGGIALGMLLLWVMAGLALIFLPWILGLIWIYNDANRQGQNGALWALAFHLCM